MRIAALSLIAFGTACSAGGGPLEDGAGASNAGSGGLTTADGGSGGTSPAGTAGTNAGNAGNLSGDSGGSGGTNSGTGGTAEGTGIGGGTGNTSGGAWVNVTGNLGSMIPAGGTGLYIVVSQPGTDRIIAGVLRGGLYATDDDATTWLPLGVGAGSATLGNIPQHIVFDPNDPSTFWECGAYGSGAVYKTTDNGQTFTRLGSVFMADFLGIDFTDPDRKTMITGGHEASQKVYLSTDSGANWSEIGQSLPAGSGFSNSAAVVDSTTYLVGLTANGSALGVYRTTNSGSSFTQVSSEAPFAAPLWASDGTAYWALAHGGIIVSHDKGETWSKSNGPTATQSGTPIELPDGRIVTLGNDHLQASSDGGETWASIGEKLPFAGANCGIYSVAYSATFEKLYIAHNDCSGKFLPDSVYSSSFKL